MNQQVRREIFRDYDKWIMTQLLTILDIFTDESTLKNEFGNILTIRSSNEDVQPNTTQFIL